MRPYYFDEFFASGQEETISPFLIPSSRKWGKNLNLRLALTAACFLLATFITSFFSIHLSHLFLIVVYFLAGTPALIRALENLRNLEININVLMVLAALLSVTIGSGREGGLLLVLFELSAAMEGVVEHKTKSALIHLNRLSPTKAAVLDEKGNLHECASKEIRPGMHILIKAGEVVPLDGTVISGSSFVNLVHLTGESIPVPCTVGSTVPAGARNLDGTLTLEVTHTSADSTLSHIIHLITKAQGAKPRVQRLLDRLGKRYAFVIILLAILFALLLPPFFSLPYLGTHGSVYRALTFLIAASPCALIISTPTAYLSAISACSKRGILLKGGVIFDALTNCHHIAFDKTGTLTTGKLTLERLVTLIPSDTVDETTALKFAAALEKHTVHPIAEAIVNHAKEQNLSHIELTHFKSIAGAGLAGTSSDITLHIGNLPFISKHIPKELQNKWSDIEKKLTQEEGMFTLLFAGNGLFAFYFQDEIRGNIPAMLLSLKKENLNLVMLTGDRKINADAIASLAGIDTVFAHLSPKDKLKKVARLSKEKGLAMVGEGINDAPALARATVGISLGKIGSHAAVDASDVIFLHDEITLLPWLFKKAKKTLSIVRQNLAIATLLILFASIPALLGIIPLWTAVILHEGGTILVGLNSLRLLKSFGS